MAVEAASHDNHEVEYFLIIANPGVFYSFPLFTTAICQNYQFQFSQEQQLRSDTRTPRQCTFLRPNDKKWSLSVTEDWRWHSFQKYQIHFLQEASL